MIMDKETTLLKRFMYFQMHVHKWCTLEVFCTISKFSVLPKQQDCNPELFSHYLFKKHFQNVGTQSSIDQNMNMNTETGLMEVLCKKKQFLSST
jgi:hypothetical protein